MALDFSLFQCGNVGFGQADDIVKKPTKQTNKTGVVYSAEIKIGLLERSLLKNKLLREG